MVRIKDESVGAPRGKGRTGGRMDGWTGGPEASGTRGTDENARGASRGREGAEEGLNERAGRGRKREMGRRGENEIERERKGESE